MAQRHAVVTGGAGFIGSHLCEALLARGFAVTAVDNLLTGKLANLAALEGRPGFAFAHQDVSEGIDVAGAVHLVAHLASPASPVAYAEHPLATLRVGSQGTWHALELADAHGADFLLASTSEVYGDPRISPQREDYWGNVNPVGPRSVYDEAKRFSEALTAAYRRSRGTRTHIARIFNTYGPRMTRDDGRVIPNFMVQAVQRRPFTVAGSGQQTRSFCYIDDQVAGLVALALSDEPGPVNLGTPHEITMLDLVRELAGVAGVPALVEHVDLPEDDPARRLPDIARARAALGWEPAVPLADGLARTLAWFRAELAADAAGGTERG